MSFVSRDPSPEIHLLSYTSGHPPPVIHLRSSTSGQPSISSRDPFPTTIHLGTGFISCHPSPAAIHLWPQSIWSRSIWSRSIWLQSFVSTRGDIALVWAAFRDCSCSSVSPLKVIFTNLHNVHLPLTLHRSPIIHPVTYRPS